MAGLWKCPDPECPPTDVEPFPLGSTADDVLMSRRGSRCAATFAEISFRMMRASRGAR
jgi:hypothetical protein